MKTPEQIQSELAEPFDNTEVKFKPAVVSGNRALALAYIDARCVMDRLDEVVGIGNWQTSYVHVDADGNVECRLSLYIGDEWITKADVGGPSEQPDEGDRTKAAYSDALKRAAVQFGIGRHLYRLPQQWCDYDPVKRQFTKKPTLPNMPTKVAKPTPLKPVSIPAQGELITPEQVRELMGFFDPEWIREAHFQRKMDISCIPDLEAHLYPVAFSELSILRTIRAKAKKKGVKLASILNAFDDAESLFSLTHEQQLATVNRLDTPAPQPEKAGVS